MACIWIFIMVSFLHLYHPSAQIGYSGNLLGSSFVGDACSTSTACVQGAYCMMGTCSCRSTYIAIEKHCWKKLLPEESGCTFDAQCDASWPGASCQSGTCECPPPLQAAATREGTVCHPTDECPTNGRNSLLYNRNTNTPSKCSLLNRDSWEFIGCDDYPEVHDCIAGLCCPTRALTCIQPMDAGYSSAGNFTTTRWYHDPISYSCQSFQFAGAGGNSNNFPTKVHCESYCLSRCARGQALPSYPKPAGKSSSPITFSSTSLCDSNGTMVDSTDQCCPSVDFICSEFGAVSPELIPQDSFLEVVPYSSGSQREGQRPVTRWYWNRTKKDCLPFVFFGQGGNFNNFLTKEHCSNFCSVALCPLGSPLLQSSGSPALCTSSAECPYPYFCHSGRCCPSSESVCNQPMSEGVPCLAAPLPRFWFNASAGNCQRFIYNGCQGNSNSFQSLEACQKACEGVEAEPRCPHGSALRIKYGKLRRCGANSFETECPMNYECVHDGTASGCCPTAEYICSLPRNSGRSCKQTPTLRWYFDGIASSCRSFLFHGCDGNINNFPTKQICDEFCPRTALSCPYGGEYHRRGNGEAVECSSDKQCPFNYFCTTMSRRGTELRLCCPTRLSICSQGKDEGINCGQPATRYFFDKFTQQCRPMHFLGCGGNSNNFPSKEICYNFCLSSACGMFEVVLPSSSLGISFDCSKMPCPTGYSCVSDVFTPRRKVCCGTPNTDVCPNGLQPVNDPRTLLPISCRGGQFDVCPPNYHCLLHPTKKRHFCCGSTVRTETCPSGSRLIRLETGQPLGCNSQAVCPGGTTCQRPNPVGSGVCCKTLLHACPSGFVLDQTALEECSPLHRSHCSSTSSDSLCLFAETLQKFVCCKRENQLLPPLDCCPVTSTPKPRYFSNEQQCSVSKRCKGQTVCLDGKCVCRPGQVQLRMMCYWKCPANRKNVDGICV